MVCCKDGQVKYFSFKKVRKHFHSLKGKIMLLLYLYLIAFENSLINSAFKDGIVIKFHRKASALQIFCLLL